jgi:lipopolysaccharide export system permease protein
MKILDRYIIKKFIGTFLYAVMIMAIIACVIDYSEKVEDLVHRKAPFMAVLNYFKDFVPHIVSLLFPLFIFIATIFFTSKIAYKSEVIAILASGTSFQRFLRPYMIAALLLCGSSFIANHYIIPVANKERIAFEDKYIHNPTTRSDYNVHLRLSKNTYVYLKNFYYNTNTGQQFTIEKIEGTMLKEKMIADHVEYDSVNKLWHLHGIVTRYNNGLKEELKYSNDTVQKYAFTPKDLYDDNAIKEALTTKELNAFIAREELRGRETLNFYYVEKYRRTATPVAGIILTIIGVCIASRKVRGGSGLHLALGIVISALYIMLMQFATTFSTKAGLNPLVAVWIPNAMFGLLALYLYRKQVR